jgi:hypothetical protein
MSDRPLIGPAADWVTYYIDENCGHVVITGIYDDELLALRYGNAHHERVTLFPYGPDAQGLDADEDAPE